MNFYLKYCGGSFGSPPVPVMTITRTLGSILRDVPIIADPAIFVLITGSEQTYICPHGYSEERFSPSHPQVASSNL
jgi:hypothetical protein